MRQTTLCVPLEVKPDSCSRLSAIIECVEKRENTGEDGENFGRLLRQVPVLHFMSMSVFPGAEYDPLFVLEANFDGAPGPFWAQLEVVLGDDLRAIIRCCKKPLNGDGPLYEATVDPASRTPVAAYLEARTQSPSVFHQGNRGLSRSRILEEYRLFLAIRTMLDAPPAPGEPSWRSLSPQSVHDTLRSGLLPVFSWLGEKAPERITPTESAADWLRLVLFAIIVFLILTLPGVIASALLSVKVYLWFNAVLFVLLSLWIYLNRRGLGTEIQTPFRLSSLLLGKSWLFLLLMGAFVALTSAALVPLVFFAKYILHLAAHLVAGGNAAIWHSWHPWHLFRATFIRLALGLLSLVVVLPAIIRWLRWDEMRDSSQDGAAAEERTLREILQREDWITQNHMGSIVLIKPGALRSIIVHAGHLGLGLVLRVLARDGYLGSMRTVHFAHWAFLNNGSRLLFLSNFDHSWGSYLDDFIEKAHAGLTLAWGCGVGFPPTRFLVYDGASHGRLFKAWALASRTVTRFWFSAYPALTVDQIERNNRLANGMRKASLSATEATTWCLDL